MKIEIDEKTQIAVVWSVEDVLSVCPDLTKKQAMDVLLACKESHCIAGISWDVISDTAVGMYG